MLTIKLHHLNVLMESVCSSIDYAVAAKYYRAGIILLNMLA